MLDTEKSEKFMYWKRPWQKSVLFIAIILNVISLLLDTQNYQKDKYLEDVGILAEIFTSSELKSYLAHQSFACTSKGVIVAVLFGVYLIGTFARSERAARMSEGVFFLVWFLVWGIIGFVLQIATFPTLIRIIWVVFLILPFGAAIYTFWKIRNSE